MIDAVSFLASVLSLHLIHAHEMIEPSHESPNMLREIREGLRVVYQHSLLRSSAVVFTIISLSGGIFSALVQKSDQLMA